MGEQCTPPLREAHIAGIDPSYFDVLQTPMLAGRKFTAADLAPGTRVALVDQGFVDQVLQGRNAIGQQVRFVQDEADAAARDANPWIEIVGVVKELGMIPPTEKGRRRSLLSCQSGAIGPRLHDGAPARDPMLFAPQLREIATAVDPMLRLSELQRVDQVTEPLLWVIKLWLRVTIMMTALALLLSLSRIYAVLSFIVARRTREIGVRVALGASRARIVAAIFRSPLIQVGLGIVAGADAYRHSGPHRNPDAGAHRCSLTQFAIIFGYAILMLGVCLLACVGPTRRALAVEPTVALRVE